MTLPPSIRVVLAPLLWMAVVLAGSGTLAPASVTIAGHRWVDDAGRPRAVVLNPDEMRRLARPASIRVLVPQGRVWNRIPPQDDRPGRIILRPSGSFDARAPLVWITAGRLEAGSDAVEIVLDVDGTPQSSWDVPLDVLLATEGDDSNALTDEGLRRFIERTRGRRDATATDDARRTQVRTNQQGIDFDPPDQAHAWKTRADEVRERLWVTLGLTPGFDKGPLRPKVFGRFERDGYTIEKVWIETLPGHFLGGNLYRPLTPLPEGRKRPGLLSPHGHYAEGRMHPDAQARCVQWARMGATVFLYDMVGYHDSKPFGHSFADERLIPYGLGLAGLQTWNSIRALEFLQSLPDVDPARIGCTGESGGGTQTFLLTAVEPRVAAAAPVVMVSEGFQGGCVCENTPGLRIGTDNVEIAALAAPRPLKLVAATGDWTSNTMTRVLPPLQRVYSLWGVPDHVSASLFDFGHNYNRTSREAVCPFLGEFLGLPGWDRSRPQAEPPFTPEEAATLRVTRDADAHQPEHPDDLPSISDNVAPSELATTMIAQVQRRLEAIGPLSDPAVWTQGGRATWGAIHRVRVNAAPPEAARIAVQSLGSTQGGEAVVVEHLDLRLKPFRGDQGRVVPTVLWSRADAAAPGSSRRVAVVVSSHGKAALVEPNGQASALTEALLAAGFDVAGFDPLLIGESFDPGKPTARRPDTVHFATYNPSLVGDRLGDLALVVGWLRSRDQTRSISLVGLGDGGGAWTLLALPNLGPIARAWVDLGGQGDDAIDLPGLLQFGGLAGASALCAETPLTIARPAAQFRRDWPRAARLAQFGAVGELEFVEEAPQIDALVQRLDDGSSL